MSHDSLEVSIEEDYEIKKLLRSLRQPAALRKEYLMYSEKLDQHKHRIADLEVQVSHLKTINETYLKTFQELQDQIVECELRLETLDKKKQATVKKTPKKKGKRKAKSTQSSSEGKA